MGTLPSSNSTLTYDGMGEFFLSSSTVPSVDPVVSGYTERVNKCVRMCQFLFGCTHTVRRILISITAQHSTSPVHLLYYTVHLPYYMVIHSAPTVLHGTPTVLHGTPNVLHSTPVLYTTYLLAVWTSSGKQHVLSLQLHNQLEMSVK